MSILTFEAKHNRKNDG